MPTVDLARIESETATLDIAEIAGFLQRQLGQKLTAYVGGIRDPKMVGKWIRRDSRPHDMVSVRLREAYKAVRMIVESYSADTAKAWLTGSNTRLDDQAPAMILRYAESFEDCLTIFPPAKAFAGAVN
jgi:hypothetical protein